LGGTRLKKRLADTNSADTMFLVTLGLRVGPVVMLFLLGIEYLFWGNRFIWFVIPDLALTALIVLAVYWALDRFSRAGAAILFPSGNGTPAVREYSEQDALIVRGHFAEAADAFRAVIVDNPGDISARMRLGRLLEIECKDPVGAEECYRRVRGLSPTPQQDWAVSNALIDLYNRTGQRERLKAELQRMARQYSGTTVGSDARRRYDELVGDDETPPA